MRGSVFVVMFNLCNWLRVFSWLPIANTLGEIIFLKGRAPVHNLLNIKFTPILERCGSVSFEHQIVTVILTAMSSMGTGIFSFGFILGLLLMYSLTT